MSDWDKSIGVIVSEIKMMEASAKSLYWLVEGPGDIRFFSARKISGVELIVSGGKRNVIGSIQALSAEPVNERLLGIVDADIDWLLPYNPRLNNVISTDPRDLEGVLLRSSAYFKVLAEFADPKKVAAFETLKGRSVLEYLRDVSVFFGRIRAVNDINKCVSLKKFKPQTFMVKGGWEYDYDAAIDFAVAKGVCSHTEELKEKMHSLPDVFEWNYVRGHDAINIFVGGLLGELRAVGALADIGRVESVLRAGIDEVEYKATKLHRGISDWHAAKHAQ